MNKKTYEKNDAVSAFSDKSTLYSHEQDAINAVVAQGDAILDLGCGTGRTTVQLKQKSSNIVATDISESMINDAANSLNFADFFISDASNLPFREGTFDIVLFSFNGVDYLTPESNRIQAIKEIKRVLRPEGWFIFSSHNPIAEWTPLPFFYSPKSIHDFFLFWIRNLKNNSLIGRYKIDKRPFGKLKTYYITPWGQRHQLQRLGFTAIDTYSQYKFDFIDPWPYYVAKKKNKILSCG